jgi:DUF218 domain
VRSLEPRNTFARKPLLEAICNYLVVEDAPGPADLIFVLAGRPERKVYGLELFRQGLAPRLILSVGRSEVRATEKLGFEDLQMRALTARTPPEQRHFFVELSSDSRKVIPAQLARTGTYGELSALAAAVGEGMIQSMMVVSTSVHLRRVRLCCRALAGLHEARIRYVPVPEAESSFRRESWWKRRGHWSYVAKEYCKLAGYFFVHRPEWDGDGGS